MKTFKLLLKPIKKEDVYGYVDKDEVKFGIVAFPLKGKIEDEEVNFKKGDEVAYQYGTNVKLDGEELVLTSLSNLIWQK